MNEKQLTCIIESGAAELGINLPPLASAAFAKYRAYLEDQGQKFNLTAITDAEDVARLHFLDSLALLKACDFKGTRVIDVGSGAGLPGVPLKIAEPTIVLTLLDATKKRVDFLSGLCTILEIDATCMHARAEEAARPRGQHGRSDIAAPCVEEVSRPQELRENFDIVVSRAVAQMNLLCELCLPFVRVGGLFVAMKSADSADELAEARSAIERLGAETQGCIDYQIPGTDLTHRAVIIRKTSRTPGGYPRRFAKIQRVPL